MIPIFQYDTPRGLDVPLGKILSVLLYDVQIGMIFIP